MNRKNMILFILLLVIILLGILNLMWLTSIKDTSGDAEIVPIARNNAEYTCNTKMIDVMVHNERVYPQSINAKQGDSLILSFGVVEEPMFFMLEEFGISERINTENIEVYLDKKGVFPFYCLNCENKEPGYLIVN
jgi:hypothetical protein